MYWKAMVCRYEQNFRVLSELMKPNTFYSRFKIFYDHWQSSHLRIFPIPFPNCNSNYLNIFKCFEFVRESRINICHNNIKFSMKHWPTIWWTDFPRTTFFFHQFYRFYICHCLQWGLSGSFKYISVNWKIPLQINCIFHFCMWRKTESNKFLQVSQTGIFLGIGMFI